MDENNLNSISVKRILVATDGSASSIRAANFAIHLCMLEKAELVVLHVLPILTRRCYRFACKIRRYENGISIFAS